MKAELRPAYRQGLGRYAQGPLRYPNGPALYPSGPARVAVLDAPIATSGNNTFVAWANNDTGHFGVFFARAQTATRRSKS